MPVDARLALTVRPVKQTRICLNRWFEFPIRRSLDGLAELRRVRELLEVHELAVP